MNNDQTRRVFEKYHFNLARWLLTATLSEREESGQWVRGMCQATSELAEAFGVKLGIEEMPTKELEEERFKARLQHRYDFYIKERDEALADIKQAFFPEPVQQVANAADHMASAIKAFAAEIDIELEG